MSAKRDWTSVPPDQPGWYWWRNRVPIPCEPVVLMVYEGVGGLLAVDIMARIQRLTDMGGEWWPVRIEEPQ